MPDIVILDQDMPGRTGLEILKQVRSSPLTRETPVLFLTGLAGRELLLRGFEQGLDDFISKPFDPDELNLRVRAVAARARLSGERRADLQMMAEKGQRRQLVWLHVSAAGPADETVSPRGHIAPDADRTRALLVRIAARLADLVGRADGKPFAHFFLRRDGSAWVHWSGWAPDPSLMARFSRLRVAAERLLVESGSGSVLRFLHADLSRPELYGQPGLEAALAEEMKRPVTAGGVRSLSL